VLHTDRKFGLFSFSKYYRVSTAHAATLAKGKKGVLLPFISQKYADPFDHPAYFQAYKKSFQVATGFPPTELDRLFMIRLRTGLQTQG
jgi:hypothetical protein